MKTGLKNCASRLTQEAIDQAFVELLSEGRELDKITAIDIAKRANITRSTFYTHYSSAHEVAMATQNRLLRSFVVGIRADNIEQYLDQFFEFLDKNVNICAKLLNSTEALNFINSLNQQIQANILDLLKRNASNDNLQSISLLDVTFLVDGMTYLVLRYFRGEIMLSLDEIKVYLKERCKLC